MVSGAGKFINRLSDTGVIIIPATGNFKFKVDIKEGST